MKDKYNHFGLGSSSLSNFQRNLGLNQTVVVKEITKRVNSYVLHKVNKFFGRKMELRKKGEIHFLTDHLKNVRGIRNKFRYPVRGQRTKTNAKTKRKSFF
jgi:ribosomal protein S13